MVRLCQCLGFVGLVIAGICFAQGEVPAPKPQEVVIRFLDDTTVRRAVLQDNVEIITKYGKLAVPVSDISRIELGRHISDETTKKVNDAIKRLGSDNFPLRDAASNELVALGFQAYPFLVEAGKASTDNEVLQRVHAAILAIQQQVPEELLRLKPDDVIHTRESVLTGRLASPTLKVRTVYFGELSLKLEDLRSIYAMSGSGQVLVTLDASKHAGTKDQWKDSGFIVEPDIGLVITASGQIDLIAQQAGQVMSPPDGNQTVGRTPGQAFASGTLLGRIGENGEVFAIGSRYEVRTQQGGKLYLSIQPHPRSEGATGNYSVKIVGGPNVTVSNTPRGFGRPNPTPGMGKGRGGP
jgi:hypothetical protein